VKNYEDVLDEYYNVVTNKDREPEKLEFYCGKLDEWLRMAHSKGLMKRDYSMLWV
jgi:hypothetical protein